MIHGACVHVALGCIKFKQTSFLITSHQVSFHQCDKQLGNVCQSAIMNMYNHELFILPSSVKYIIDESFFTPKLFSIIKLE